MIVELPSSADDHWGALHCCRREQDLAAAEEDTSQTDIRLTAMHRQVENGKPAPDVFTATAAAAGVPPSQCLVIEDAPAGVQVPCVCLIYAFSPSPAALLLPC